MKYVYGIFLTGALLVCVGVGSFAVIRTYGLYKEQTWGECSSAYLAKQLALRVRGLLMSVRIDVPGNDLKSIDSITFYRAPAGTALPEKGLVLPRLPQRNNYFGDKNMTVDLVSCHTRQLFCYSEPISYVLSDTLPEVLLVSISNKPAGEEDWHRQGVFLDETGPATRTFAIGPSDAILGTEGEAFSKIPLQEGVQRSYVKKYLLINVIVTSALLVALLAATFYILLGLIRERKGQVT